MHAYCRSCVDRGTEGCALPSSTERAVTVLKLAGSFILEGCAISGSIFHGTALPQEGAGLLEAGRIEADIARIPVEACIVIHKAGTLPPEI